MVCFVSFAGSDGVVLNFVLGGLVVFVFLGCWFDCCVSVCVAFRCFVYLGGLGLLYCVCGDSGCMVRFVGVFGLVLLF